MTKAILHRAARRRFGALLRDRRGALSAIVAASLIPMIGMIGLATDSARGFMIRHKLNEALDAAALAAAQKVAVEDIEAEFHMFFDANFPEGFMGATIDGPYPVWNDATRRLTATATARVDTTFMRVLGQDYMDVAARTVIQSENTGMELVLVMDNTGSMRGGGKIDAMKDAAAELIQILYGDSDYIENFWVGLVPYTATVNVGAGRTGWLRLDQDMTLWDGTGTSWKGCVEARWQTGRDMTDDPPSVERWPMYFWESTDGNDDDNEWPPLKEANSYQNDGRGPNLGCGPEITPLTSSRTVIDAGIDEMLPWHRGGTMGNLGLSWGWRVISPRWQGLWGGDTPASLPLDYDADLVTKAVIMLTDGVNQYYDHDKSDSFGSDYSAYDRVDEGRLDGETTVGGAVDVVDDKMAATCQMMKDEDIILYTITFQVNNTSTQNLFRNCATSPSHYFNSPTNEELADVFRVIANELSNLRIAE